MTDKLLNLIAENESDYIVSIHIRSKYRRLPTLTVRRTLSDRVSGDEFEEFLEPEYGWVGEELPESCSECVNDDLVKLIEVGKRFGDVITNSRSTIFPANERTGE